MSKSYELEEDIKIIDAHLRGRYTSIYLFDAWNHIKEFIESNTKNIDNEYYHINCDK